MLWNITRSTVMKVWRMKRLKEVTGLGRSTVYKYIAEGLFPKQIQLGPRCVGWLEEEVLKWIEERVKERLA